jgi:hypothetical protein
MSFRDFWCVFRVPLRLMAADGISHNASVA